MKTLIIGIAVGIAVTPLAAMLGILSGGAGHGHYEFARLFFPYSMLFTRLAENRLTLPLIVLALSQFPIYGAILGLFGPRRWMIIGGVILVIHSIAAGFCFSGVIPNFS